MTRARDIADLVDANGDIVVGALANVPPSNDASALTTGTLPDGRFPATLPAVSGANLTGIVSFASGTLMLFQQTSAPTGWTKQTTHNDKALRVVTGTVGSGGSSGFTTAFGTPSVTGTIAGSTGSHTLTVSEMPSHNHSVNYYYGSGTQPVTGGGTFNATYVRNTNSTGGGGSHSHSLSASFSGGAAAINVEYVDLIIASKD